LFVAASIRGRYPDERGLHQFIKDHLASLSTHRFVEFIPQHGDDLTVRFGFTLLGRDFEHLQIRRATLASVQWGSGQATSLAGHDMNDWSVVVCYNHKGSKKGDYYL